MFSTTPYNEPNVLFGKAVKSLDIGANRDI